MRGIHPVVTSRVAGTLTANTTTTFYIPTPGRSCVLSRVWVHTAVVPVDADGTILARFRKWDVSDNAAVTLTSDLDLEALVAKKATGFTISPSVTEFQLWFDSTDVAFIEVTNNSAAIDTQPSDMHFVVEWLLME